MDFTDGGTLAILASVITAVIEVIKAWIPKKYKDDNGLVFTRKSGKKLHLPNQAVWPLVSLAIGIAVFFALRYNIFDGVMPTNAATQAVGGTAAGLGAKNGVYRIKDKLGTALGGNPTTSAQKSGPTIEQKADTIETEEPTAPTVVTDIPDDANYF